MTQHGYTVTMINGATQSCTIERQATQQDARRQAVAFVQGTSGDRYTTRREGGGTRYRQSYGWRNAVVRRVEERA